MNVRKEDMPQPQEPERKKTSEELKTIALKQRIGELTSDYEEKIADIRVYITQMQEHYEEIKLNQENEIEALRAQLRTYQENESVQAEADAEASQD